MILVTFRNSYHHLRHYRQHLVGGGKIILIFEIISIFAIKIITVLAIVTITVIAIVILIPVIIDSARWGVMV